MKIVKFCQICGSKNAKCCSSCKSMYYCSKECQKLDWYNHKKECKEISLTDKPFFKLFTNKISKLTFQKMTNIMKYFNGRDPRKYIINFGTMYQHNVQYYLKLKKIAKDDLKYTLIPIDELKRSSKPYTSFTDFCLNIIEQYSNTNTLNLTFVFQIEHNNNIFNSGFSLMPNT